MRRWEGRVALVTGASSGIGRAISLALAKLGVRVVACARRTDRLETLKTEADAAGGHIIPMTCDLRDETQILAMFKEIREKVGGVDICINNAGHSIRKPLATGSTEDWKLMLDVNVLALAICTREALASMKERDIDDGHIIHISSTVAHNVPSQLAMYSATKFAVSALTEGLRQELLAEKSGIRVTAVSPALVRTEMIEETAGPHVAKMIFGNANHLSTEDVVESVIHVLSAPKHVQVHEVIVHAVGKGTSI